MKKKEVKRENVLLKMVFWALCFVFMFGVAKPPTVHAASSSTMKKAYEKYVSDHRGEFKYYAYVNIGPDKKPALLTADAYSYGSIKNCDIYYYVNNKVKFLANYGASRAITLMSKGGNYYINTGTSSDAMYAYIRNNKLYITEFNNSKFKNWKTQKTTSKSGNKVYTTYSLSTTNYAAYKSKYKMVKTVSFAKAPAESKTIPSSWQKTYYKAINKTDYVKVTLKKSDYTVKLYQKGKTAKTIENGYYKTWDSEAIQYQSNGKLMYGRKSGILFEMHRKSSGKIINMEFCKHIYYNKQALYIPGNYYSSLNTARKYIQKVKF